jgi:hypothetical protein
MNEKIPTISVRSRFRTIRWSYRRKLLRDRVTIVGQALRTVLQRRERATDLAAPFQPHEVGRDFFGINVAASPSRELEDYHLDRLRALGVTHVRTDYAYESDRPATERWIGRLCAEDFDVLVHIVQPFDDASQMDHEGHRDRWIRFLEKVFQRFEGKVHRYEIGSTPNRHRWSGYSIGDYAAAFRAAHQVAGDCGVELIGPNVHGFAPGFLATLLDELRGARVYLPLVTLNLGGTKAGPTEAGMNKASRRGGTGLADQCMHLEQIARDAEMGSLACTYADWPAGAGEEHCADSLTRLLVLAAAAGTLQRIYCGQLSGFPRGLIDNGERVRYDPPAAYQCLQNAGSIGDYRERPAFAAFRTLVNQLAGARFVRSIETDDLRKAYVFEFEKQDGCLWVGWTTNGTAMDPRRLAPGLALTSAIDRDGQEIAGTADVKLTKTPVFLRGDPDPPSANG